MTTEYLIVLPVEEFSVGAVYKAGESLPLHCTVMGWFSLSEDRAESLNELLPNVARFTHQFVLESVGEDMFGPSKTIPVNILARTDALMRLHNVLLENLALFGFITRTAVWTGRGYRPHVTPVGDRALEQGERHTVTSMVLVRRDPQEGRKEVVSTHPLRS